MKRFFSALLLTGLLLSGAARAATVAVVASGQLTQQQAQGAIKLTGAVEIAGLTLNNVQIEIAGDGVYIHGCTLTGASWIVVDPGCNHLRIVRNTFAVSVNQSIRGYPLGTDLIIEHNLVDTRGQKTSGNDNSEEWLHLQNACDHLSVSYNVIESNLLRWAFELQSGMTNVTVHGNYIHAAKGGSGMSVPVGGESKAPFAHAGQNVDVSGNVVLIDAAPGQNCCLEIDGDKNITASGNYLSGGRVGIVNGTGGQNGGGLVTSGNTIIPAAGGAWYSDYDNTPWQVPPRVSTLDKLFKLGDPSIPAPPAPPGKPTDAGAATDGVVVAAALPSIDLGLKATSGVDTVSWSWTPQTVPAVLTLVLPSNGNPQPLGTVQIAAGTAGTITHGLSANWVVSATLGTPNGQQTLAAQCLANAGDAASAPPISTPATPSTGSGQAPAIPTTTPVPSTPSTGSGQTGSGQATDLVAMEADVATKLQAFQTAQAAYVAALKAAAGK